MGRSVLERVQGEKGLPPPPYPLLRWTSSATLCAKVSGGSPETSKPNRLSSSNLQNPCTPSQVLPEGPLGIIWESRVPASRFRCWVRDSATRLRGSKTSPQGFWGPSGSGSLRSWRWASRFWSQASGIRSWVSEFWGWASRFWGWVSTFRGCPPRLCRGWLEGRFGFHVSRLPPETLAWYFLPYLLLRYGRRRIVPKQGLPMSRLE